MVANEEEPEAGQNLTDPILQEIEEVASRDPVYQSIIKLVQSGFPSQASKLDSAAHQYWSVRDELSTEDGLLLKGHRLVIPEASRPETRKQLHASHQGMERTKRRARQTVFWPGINSDIAKDILFCVPCSVNADSLQKEPMESDPPPSRPFQDVSADLFQHGSNHFLVFSDRYSGWPILFKWNKDPTARNVAEACARAFTD